MDGRFLSDESGLTLIEVVVALVLIALLAVAFVPMISTSVRFIIQAGERYQNMAELQRQMEVFMAEHSLTETNDTVFPIRSMDSAGQALEIPGKKITVKSGEEEVLVTFITALED